MADKIFLLALCGAADRPADGPTSLERARMPHLSALAARGALGTLTVIDPAIPPESDSGALALLGYDPIAHYTGRGPLEGFGNGFLRRTAGTSTVCFRLNMASYDAARGRFDRRTARDLSDEELQALLDEVRAKVSLADHDAHFEIMGFGRHRGVVALHSTKPLSGNVSSTDPEYGRIGAFGVPRPSHGDGPVPCLPLDDSGAARHTADLVEDFLDRSAAVLSASEVNHRRLARGRLAANRIIVRDGGDRLPELRPFREVHGRSLTIYGQVPAERGLAQLMDAGWVDCRKPADLDEAEYYAALAKALRADPADVVYVHVKGPDEAAHDGDLDGKVSTLERVDELLLGELVPLLHPADTLVVTCDHATPWQAGIHTADPVPVLVVAGDGAGRDTVTSFTERAAAAGSLGHRTARELLPALTAPRRDRTDHVDPGYLRRGGATFRGVINDLKRNTAAAAADLDVDTDLLDRVIDGDIEVPDEVLRRAVARWPVSKRDFHPIVDDARDGVRVLRAGESARTSRVFQRGGVDYYEYRDTAMSRVAMFRPEWIRMLQPVTDDDPDNPAVRWNNGHFLYQFTYFVGAVNYYYEWDGVRHCATMNTGDSVSGLPYAPHSFASRDGQPGLILALTYGGRLLGDAQHEIGALGPELAERYAPEPAGDGSPFARLLGEHLADALTTPAQVATAAGVSPARLAALAAGAGPTPAEVDALAAALRVNPRDLLPVVGDEVDGVRIVRGDRAETWLVPDAERPAYRVKALAGTLLCPSTRALEIDVLGRDVAPARLRTGLHQYCYVLGPGQVRLTWEHDGETFERVLDPDDSLYLKPFVPHAFTLTGSGECAVLALRIGGKVSGDARREAAALGRPTLRRLVADTGQWYDPAGARTAAPPASIEQGDMT